MTSLSAIAARLPDYDPQALPADTATAFLQALVTPLQDSPCRIALQEALDRILDGDVIAPRNVPPHDNSAMDGYAFDGALLDGRTPLVLRISGTALAGSRGQEAAPRQPHDCVRIMTGAVMPAGLDTVVPQELVHVEGDQVHIPGNSVRQGDNRRLCGEDLRQGSPALRDGLRIGPAALGLLASLGLTEVKVRRRLRVAYFSTGDEILQPGEAAREGAVYDSNRYTLCGLLERLGVQAIDLGVVPDQPQALQAAFSQAAACADAVITSGGVSMGAADHTQDALRRAAGSDDAVVFWKIAMRPGRPMAVGRLGQAILFGLPGNPVAVMVAFLAFVRPALLRMMGCQTPATPWLQARTTEPLRKKPGRTEYQRAVVRRAADGSLEVSTTGHQGSGVLRSMVEANGRRVLPHAQGNLAAGAMGDVRMFDGAL